MPRPFDPFRGYEFFGVLFPGLASVIFLYLLLPSEIRISLPAGIIFVLVFAFVFGQALHSVALFVEALPAIATRHMSIFWSHREEFRQQINNPTYSTEQTIQELRKKASFQFPEFKNKMGFSDNKYSMKETQILYTSIRSHLHSKDQSRSGNLKAMYGFCRNMCVLLYGLVPLYLIYGHLSTQADIGNSTLEIIDRNGKYINYFPDYFEFLQAAVPLAMLGGTIFLIATFIYQRFYIQYLISDYLVTHDTESDSVVYGK